VFCSRAVWCVCEKRIRRIEVNVRLPFSHSLIDAWGRHNENAGAAFVLSLLYGAWTENGYASIRNDVSWMASAFLAQGIGGVRSSREATGAKRSPAEPGGAVL
jgi:hypothetical protein